MRLQLNARSRSGTNVCFVHTPCLELRDDRLEPPLGMLYMATLARSRGYDARIVDLSADESVDLVDRIPDGCEIYGFSTYSVNYGKTRELAAAVRRRNPGAVLIAGGPHATALAHEVVADGFDVVVVGEGECAILQILECLERGQPLPRTVYGEPPNPLDDLPFPDYDLVYLDSYRRVVNGERCISILSSRGCPYRCTFCNSNIMGAGKPMRYRSPQNVSAEIRCLKQRFGVRHFRFQDDIFTITRQRVAEMAPWLAAEDIVYRCFARTNTCASSPEVCENLKAGGCIHLSFGVETGSPKLLHRHSMHKNQTPEQIRQALGNAHAVGLRSRIFLIVGFPGEADETIEETLALVKSCPWDEFSVYPLIAYPGTPLHDQPEEYGITYIDRNYSDYLQIGKNFRAGFTIRTKDFNEHKVRQWRDYVIDELQADGRTWAGDSKNFK